VDLQKANNFAEASKQFELAVALNTNNIPAALNLEYNHARGTPAAKENAQRNLAQDFFGQYRSWDGILSENGPFDVPEFLYFEGQAFLQQFLVRQACDEFKRAGELDPTNAIPKLSLIGALIHGKWLDEAHKHVAELEAATNITSKAQKLDLISMQAAIYFGRQETNRAEQTLRAAIEMYPKEAGFYESLNELYRASGQWSKAVEILNPLVTQMPTNAMLRMQRADLAFNAGDTNMAIADLDAALQVDPSLVDASLFRVFIAIQQKDFTKALALVDGLLERNNQNAQAWTYKGIIHMEQKEDEKSIEAFTKSLKFEPNNVTTVRNRAIVNLRAGHLKAAQDDYEMLLAAFPKSHQIYYGLAEVAARKKDNAAALNNYEMYLKYAPTNVAGEAELERKTVEARVKELKAGK
jgi:tetratricopeptide (TPR) repeat protein